MSDIIDDVNSKKGVPARDEFNALSEKVDAIKDMVLYLEAISNPRPMNTQQKSLKSSGKSVRANHF